MLVRVQRSSSERCLKTLDSCGEGADVLTIVVDCHLFCLGLVMELLQVVFSVVASSGSCLKCSCRERERLDETKVVVDWWCHEYKKWIGDSGRGSYARCGGRTVLRKRYGGKGGV